MHIVPVLLDDAPSYAAPGDDTTVLSLPGVNGTAEDRWAEWLAHVCYHAPRIVAARPTAESMTLARLVREPLAWFDPFDWVLFVSARLMPSTSDGLEALRARHDAGERAVLHLLSTERVGPGTREVVHADAGGTVRRIQRYLDPRTMWQQRSEVIATLVPVSSLLQLPADSAISTLDALRAELVRRRSPSADLPEPSRVFDLHDEEGALAFIHQQVRGLRVVRATGRARMGGRVRGPVVIEDGAVVAPDALLVGPLLICAGAQVLPGARVAQCVLLPGSHVGAGESVRHRMLAGAASEGAVRQRRHTPARAMQVERVAIDAHNVAYLRLRSVVEAVIAVVMLVVLSPLYALIALAVKLTSHGPVFYGDPREGLNGRLFRCWKFRTMRPDAAVMQRELAAEQFADGPHFKIASDPRLTSIGRWLRALNFDELPQLLNVVMREMSFVGPRPSPFKENQICAPWRQARLAVRPGITGLWQVCRHDRASGDFHQWIEYDLLYVEHVSFLVDLRILIATVLTLGGKRPVSVDRILPGQRSVARADVSDGSALRRAASQRAERLALREASALEPVP